jgi:threonyl-tRNA synthetase
MNNIKGSYILSFALDLLDFKIAINNFGTKDDINYIEFFSENKVTEKDFIKIEKFIKKAIDSNIDVKISNQTIENLSNTYLNSIKNYENKNSVVLFKNFIYPLFSSELQEFKSNEIRFFKLLNVSGSYLDSSADSLVLTRIYFICSTDKNDLEQKIAEFNLRSERDHRKISKDLDIFSTDLLTGQGMII